MYSDTSNHCVTILYQLYIEIVNGSIKETVKSGDRHHKPLVKGYIITCCLFPQLVRYITMKEL